MKLDNLALDGGRSARPGKPVRLASDGGCLACPVKLAQVLSDVGRSECAARALLWLARSLRGASGEWLLARAVSAATLPETTNMAASRGTVLMQLGLTCFPGLPSFLGGVS